VACSCWGPNLLWSACLAGACANFKCSQVQQSESYRLLAEENRINLRLIPPARGLITDRNGSPIAINRQNYRITIIREQARDSEAVLRKLSEIIELSEERIQKVLKDVSQRPAFVPVAVTEHLSWQDIAQVAANAPALPGIIPEVGLTRYYPQGKTYAHAVGYVGPVSDYDLSKIESPDPLLQIPKFQIGKSGIEKFDEQTLRGAAGNSRIEVNSLGRVMRELSRVDGTPGADLQLTIDQKLQSYALKRMGGESAAAVVIEVATGDLRAMASAPSFDPNKFVFGISVADYNALNTNEFRPLYDKTVSGEYPPGSTFKMVVALAGLESGEVTNGETVYCPGYMQLGKRRFHCWRRGGHGQMNLKNSLRSSCDVYYYEIARRVGIERITQMANKLGLGIKHDIPVPAVRKGLTPSKSYKEGRFGQPWLVGDTLNSGIGQGFTLASPLPRLVRARDGKPIPITPPEPLDISENALNAVRVGMFSVVNDQRGTARRSQIADDQNLMAGKTGTSQVRNITAAERAQGVTRNEDLPWNRRDHALFVGFAPYDNPKYAVAVVVEHGGGGSKAAAPIARDILMHAIYDGLAPLSAYPGWAREEERQRREEDIAPTPTPEDSPNPRDRA